MLIFLSAILNVAGVAFLFWQLRASDKTAADRLRASLAEEVKAAAASEELAVAPKPSNR